MTAARIEGHLSRTPDMAMEVHPLDLAAIIAALRPAIVHESTVFVWTQKGTGEDGDPLRAVTGIGDMTAEVLLSRGTGLWNARGNRFDGRLGFRTQAEARAYAETAMKKCISARMASARACLAAFGAKPHG